MRVTLDLETGNCSCCGAEVQKSRAGPGRKERGCLGCSCETVWRTVFLERSTASTASSKSLATAVGAKRAPQLEMSAPWNTARLHVGPDAMDILWKVDSLVSIKSTCCHPGAVLHAGKYITLPAEPTIQFHHFQRLQPPGAPQSFSELYTC